MSQVQLAAAAGLSLATLSLAERFGIVTDRSAERLAKVLGVPPEQLQVVRS